MNAPLNPARLANVSTATSRAPEAVAPYGGRLMFAQSWEDPACDFAALRPRSGETMLAITSGGDNVLAFLLADPERIVSVDLNPLQTWLFELKRAAFGVLSHSDLRMLFGLDAGDAEALYRRVRPELSAAARAYWDGDRRWREHGRHQARDLEP